MKGAIEYMIKVCINFREWDNNLEVLTEEKKADLDRIVTAMNNETYRTLGIAYKYVSETDLELL